MSEIRVEIEKIGRGGDEYKDGFRWACRLVATNGDTTHREVLLNRDQAEWYAKRLATRNGVQKVYEIKGKKEVLILQ